MAKIIKVPNKVIGIRFLDMITEEVKVENSKKNSYFHKNSYKNSCVWYTAQIDATKNPFYQGHLDPVKGQLIIGLDEIAEDYNHEPSPKNKYMPNWGAGNQLGGLYVLTKEDLKRRLGCNEIGVGEVNHPFYQHKILTHIVSKNNLMISGDKVVCIRHSGDCFFDYQLLYEVEGDLVVVKGMDFGAYALLGEPTKIIKVEYIIKPPLS